MWCVLIQLQEKGEALQEREREVTEVKSRLEGEIGDLHRDLNDKKKVLVDTFLQYCVLNVNRYRCTIFPLSYADYLIFRGVH